MLLLSRSLSVVLSNSLEPTLEKRLQILEVARSMRRTPFKHQGRLPGCALDCGGLLVCTAERVGGLQYADTSQYSRQPWSRRFKKFLQTNLREISIEEGLSKPATILLFHMKDHPKIQNHTGFYTGPESHTIIHAWISVWKVVESPISGKPNFLDWLDSAYDFKVEESL